MRNFPVTLWRHFGLGLFGLGLLCSLVAAGLLVSHTRLFSIKRDTAVMIGTALPERRSAVSLLASTVEAEQLFQQNALASREEQAAAYILPDGSPVPRAVHAIQETVLALAKDGGMPLSLASLTFDAASKDHGSTKTVGGILTLRGTYQAVARFLGVLSFSGDMMLKDVITREAQEAFLRQVEAHTPLSLRAAEDFLYLDLLQYAAAPDQMEQSLLRDMPADSAQDIRAFLLENGIAAIRSAFDRIAPRLRDQNVWPLPLLRVDHVVRDGEKWTVEFTLFSR